MEEPPLTDAACEMDFSGPTAAFLGVACVSPAGAILIPAKLPILPLEPSSPGRSHSSTSASAGNSAATSPLPPRPSSRAAIGERKSSLVVASLAIGLKEALQEAEALPFTTTTITTPAGSAASPPSPSASPKKANQLSPATPSGAPNSSSNSKLLPLSPNSTTQLTSSVVDEVTVDGVRERYRRFSRKNVSPLPAPAAHQLRTSSPGASPPSSPTSRAATFAFGPTGSSALSGAPTASSPSLKLDPIEKEKTRRSSLAATRAACTAQLTTADTDIVGLENLTSANGSPAKCNDTPRKPSPTRPRTLLNVAPIQKAAPSSPISAGPADSATSEIVRVSLDDDDDLDEPSRLHELHSLASRTALSIVQPQSKAADDHDEFQMLPALADASDASDGKKAKKRPKKKSTEALSALSTSTATAPTPQRLPVRLKISRAVIKGTVYHRECLKCRICHGQLDETNFHVDTTSSDSQQRAAYLCTAHYLQHRPRSTGAGEAQGI